MYLISLSNEIITVLPADYLSLTIDTSLVLGGHWWGQSSGTKKGVSIDTVAPLDLKDRRLLSLSRFLAPAMLRIGGTEADRLGYKVKKRKKNTEYDLVLKRKLWRKINAFAESAGFQVLFTLSAGPSERKGTGAWDPENAGKLISFTAKRGYGVAAWELGNEVNGYPFIHGLRHRVGAARYARDFEIFSRLVRRLHPEARAVGPSSAVWPVIGEPNPIIPVLGRSDAMAPEDVVSWHYYPQQSSRGRFANRRAGEKTLLAPRRLDAVLRPARKIRKAARGREIWITETGHALYGGEPGLSDTYLSTLWWLDELGLLAGEGVSRVFRQSLTGSDYGLLDQISFEPRPDYYASFLWKKLMGPLVYERPKVEGVDKRIRVYCHSRKGKRKSLCLLLINLLNAESLVELPGAVSERYVLSPEGAVTSSRVLLNGVLATEDLLRGWGKMKVEKKYRAKSEWPGEVDASGTLGGGRKIRLPPYGAAFITLKPGS
jgi:heparanase 1